jgi:dTDP-4-amino-4,6-dideoxygalactose transaminase
MAEARSAIAARYDALFADSSLVETPPRRTGDQHAWHLYVVRLALEELSIDRAEVIRRLGEAGIGASVHFIPLHLHPHYQQRYGYSPATSRCRAQLRTLHLASDLARDDR